MRVLMIHLGDIHYAARVQREALALANAGWEVDIACLHANSQPPPELHERIRLLRFPISTKRIKRYVEKKADRRVKKGVYRVVRTPIVKLAKDVVAQRQFANKVWELSQEGTYDAVHCHDLNTLSIGVYLKRKKGYALIYDSHELFNEMNGKGRLEKIFGYQAESWWIGHVDRLITVNSLMEKEFQKRYPSVKTAVVRNIPEKLPSLPDKKDYFHRWFGFDERDRIVLFQGGLFRNRGLEELIQAVACLPDEVKLVLLGSGEWKEQLVRLVHRLEQEHRVFFHPPVFPRELLPITCHADLGVVLYQSTCLNNDLSTPTNIYEYIQAGLPVLASDQPGKALAVESTGAGRLVNPLDIPGIAQAIKEMLAEPEPYIEKCIQARPQLNWEKEQERLLRLYEEIDIVQEKERSYVSIQPQLKQL